MTEIEIYFNSLIDQNEKKTSVLFKYCYVPARFFLFKVKMAEI